MGIRRASTIASDITRYTVTEAVYDASTLGYPKMIVLGFQHLFAMFGATVLVPTLVGLNVSNTLLFTGLGTLLFHFITKRKVPSFLGSSFAFLAGYLTIAPNGEEELLPYACLGVTFAGLCYLVLALIIKIGGIERIMKYFPPIVTGPIIIAIGLTLSQSAINNCAKNWLTSSLTVILAVSCNIWGKGLIRIIPGLLSILGSVILTSLLLVFPHETVNGYICMYGNENFRLFSEASIEAIKNVSWIGFPFKLDNTIIYVFKHLDMSLAMTAIITIVPIAVATIVEHIGDISAISSTCNRNFLSNPGLHRTLTGDGLATILASLFGAPANTTYGENTGVLTISKVYDPKVLEIAAIISIILSFSPKIAAFVSAIPTATTGGISLILYGMISAVGVRNIIENKVNFTRTRNVILAGLILVLSIGVTYSDQGSFIISFGKLKISLSGLAIGSLVGIFFNAILPEKDYEFHAKPYESPIKNNEIKELPIIRSRELSEVKIIPSCSFNNTSDIKIDNSEDQKES
ncbi:uracil-xanthine permease [Anaeromyces robustus]|uniref:Uracil-xanthine permease n=1 Tax=Anaeromyces robustus TaxID=1754192 RepID=A0A1Y1X1P2_9FUNG|nr:uracil-xanthine permease [Anaeromyces robustus]|eukprot:ORX79727.1 uracil-xanthine permease [Anaeromyces robustus]